MSNVVQLGSRKPKTEPATGPHFAGSPIKEAFPAMTVRRPGQIPRNTPFMLDGEVYFLEEDGPEGTA
ncbi:MULTISPECIES: hypothetical protein [unclassified Rhizobium]|uniref:hypothetical protein n=1 Tax=unclassified Rhizobium TaxID=2613769 RepID=UPI0007149422|nr:MULTISPECIES: hypothetical protein [unclassified Rhizobium]KQT03196.1 hypothetical protein ASG42_24610 [Rhizobium sp. Leaf391]KQU08409.1 hypothetical protein ASG68_22750 [Rhizobium sp. Leaf453]